MGETGHISTGVNQLRCVQMKAATSAYTCGRSGPEKLDRKAVSSAVTSLCKAGHTAGHGAQGAGAMG